MLNQNHTYSESEFHRIQFLQVSAGDAAEPIARNYSVYLAAVQSVGGNGKPGHFAATRERRGQFVDALKEMKLFLGVLVAETLDELESLREHPADQRPTANVEDSGILVNGVAMSLAELREVVANARTRARRCPELPVSFTVETVEGLLAEIDRLRAAAA